MLPPPSPGPKGAKVERARRSRPFLTFSHWHLFAGRVRPFRERLGHGFLGAPPILSGPRRVRHLAGGCGDAWQGVYC